MNLFKRLDHSIDHIVNSLADPIIAKNSPSDALWVSTKRACATFLLLVLIVISEDFGNSVWLKVLATVLLPASAFYFMVVCRVSNELEDTKTKEN